MPALSLPCVPSLLHAHMPHTPVAMLTPLPLPKQALRPCSCGSRRPPYRHPAPLLSNAQAHARMALLTSAPVPPPDQPPSCGRCSDAAAAAHPGSQEQLSDLQSPSRHSSTHSVPSRDSSSLPLLPMSMSTGQHKAACTLHGLNAPLPCCTSDPPPAQTSCHGPNPPPPSQPFGKQPLQASLGGLAWLSWGWRLPGGGAHRLPPQPVGEGSACGLASKQAVQAGGAEARGSPCQERPDTASAGCGCAHVMDVLPDSNGATEVTACKQPGSEGCARRGCAPQVLSAMSSNAAEPAVGRGRGAEWLDLMVARRRQPRLGCSSESLPLAQAGHCVQMAVLGARPSTLAAPASVPFTPHPCRPVSCQGPGGAGWCGTCQPRLPFLCTRGRGESCAKDAVLGTTSGVCCQAPCRRTCSSAAVLAPTFPSGSTRPHSSEAHPTLTSPQHAARMGAPLCLQWARVSCAAAERHSEHPALHECMCCTPYHRPCCSHPPALLCARTSTTTTTTTRVTKQVCVQRDSRPQGSWQGEVRAPSLVTSLASISCLTWTGSRVMIARSLATAMSLLYV